ncbi:MAG: restriction endonuclease subunit S [Desulfamplus sp.]|nr:restriction endonuclease subunit S [Desulfamplus sp.]
MNLDDWQHKKLSELAEYINGYAFKPDDWSKEGLPIVRIEQLKNPESITDYYSGEMPEKNIIDNGDLIFSWSASLFLKIWKHGKAALNQHLFKVIEAQEVDRIFLKQFIEFYLSEITKASHGSTMQHITRKELDRFGALFPINKPEQSKIAEILSTVDKAIEQTEALIAKQQRIKTGLMQDLLTKGIDENGNLRSEKTHKFKDSPLGRIPEEWTIERVESVSEFVTSGARGWAQYYTEDGAIFLRIGNLTRDHINLRFDDVVFVKPPESAEGRRTYVEEGDLLISVTADIGIIGIVPSKFGEGYVNQHIALVRLNHQRVYSRFVGWFLSSYEGQTQFSKLNESGAKAGLNLPTVRSLMFLKPELEEQKKIAVILDQSSCVINNHICNKIKLKALKTALMQDLLTGKVRVAPLLNNEVENE